MLDIIKDVKKNYNIDDTRVYLTGFQLGGMFVYHVINKAADKFAAFVSTGGYLYFKDANTSSSRPVPIMHIHSKNDDVVPYSGVEDYIKAWAQAQNCNMNPKVTENDSYKITHYTGGDCKTEVMLCSVFGGGSYPNLINQSGAATSNLSWLFLRQYSTECGEIDDSEGDIPEINLTVEFPEVGKNASEFSVTPDENSHCEGLFADVLTKDREPMDLSTILDEDTEYILKIRLFVESGHQFTSDPTINVNGNPVTDKFENTPTAQGIYVSFTTEKITAVDNISVKTKASKRIKNGHIIIERNGIEYNLIGKQL